MALGNASVTGTVKNTGTIPCTFKVNLWIQVFDAGGISRSGPTASSTTLPELAAGATSASVSLANNFPLPLASDEASRWYMNAYVTVDRVSPVPALAVASSGSVTAYANVAVYGATWTGTPTIARHLAFLNAPVAGQVSLEGSAEVEGDFTIGIGQDVVPTTNWWPWIIGGGIVLFALGFFRQRRRRRKS